jgi:hypothetical protein
MVLFARPARNRGWFLAQIMALRAALLGDSPYPRYFFLIKERYGALARNPLCWNAPGRTQTLFRRPARRPWRDVPHGEGGGIGPRRPSARRPCAASRSPRPSKRDGSGTQAGQGRYASVTAERRNSAHGPMHPWCGPRAGGAVTPARVDIKADERPNHPARASPPNVLCERLSTRLLDVQGGL